MAEEAATEGTLTILTSPDNDRTCPGCHEWVDGPGHMAWAVDIEEIAPGVDYVITDEVWHFACHATAGCDICTATAN